MAIKVMRSDSSSSIKENPELNIPRYLSSLDPGVRIQIPQDHFFEHGVNGSHLCLVYQLAGPSILSMSCCPGRYEGSRRLKKRPCQESSQAVSLHSGAHAQQRLCPWRFVAIFLPEERLTPKIIQTSPQSMSCSALLKTLQIGLIKNFISTLASQRLTQL